MQGSVVVVTAPGRTEMQTFSVPEVSGDEVLVESIYSIVSAGTERANLIGLPNTSGQFPYYPGYSTCGRVVGCGGAVTKFRRGDRVLVPWGGHRSHTVKREAELFPLPDERLSDLDAAWGHIASFPLLGVRKLRLETGEAVMVAGLGILGQLAVQLAALSGGCPVLAADPDPARRELALRLGADQVFDPGEPDFIDRVLVATGGAGVPKVVEVSGQAVALRQALEYIGWMGTVSLLGCTRVSDVPIDFYRQVHRRGIQLIGSHTMARPKAESQPGMWCEWDDYGAFVKLVIHGRLRVRELLSEVVPADAAPEIYNRLATAVNPPLGWAIDWQKR